MRLVREEWLAKQKDCELTYQDFYGVAQTCCNSYENKPFLSTYIYLLKNGPYEKKLINVDDIC